MRVHHFGIIASIWFSVLLASVSGFAQNDVGVSFTEPKVTATTAAEPFPGQLMHFVKPVYPQQAKDEAIEGSVVVSFVVTNEGAVEQIESVSGNRVLVDAGISAVKLWKFRPFKLDGRTIAKPQRVSFYFTIRDNPNFKQEASLPPAARQGPKLYWVDSSTSPEVCLRQVKPVYPKEALASGIQGTVLLKAVVGRDGAVRNLTPVSGFRELIQPAIDAVREWRYRPYFMNSEPVEVAMSVTVNFTKNGNRSSENSTVDITEVPLNPSPTAEVLSTERYSVEIGSSKMQITKSDLGTHYRLEIEFKVKGNNPDEVFDLIKIYGLQRVEGKLSRLPETMFSPVRGNWKTGERVSFQVNVPKQFADPAHGWNLYACAGTAKGCYPSDNLLANPTLADNALEYYDKGDYSRALPLYRQVIAADPTNEMAHAMAASCALALRNYAYVTSELRREGLPNAIRGTLQQRLLSAYAEAGMKAERDAELLEVRKRSGEGKLPADFSFTFDSFSAGNKKVEVTAFFPNLSPGEYRCRYIFHVRNTQGKEEYQVALESDDRDQVLWSKQHKELAASGQREFSLDGYAKNYHTTYGFYDGEPSYETLRTEVEQIVRGRKKPLSSTHTGQIPAKDDGSFGFCDAV